MSWKKVINSEFFALFYMLFPCKFRLPIILMLALDFCYTYPFYLILFSINLVISCWEHCSNLLSGLTFKLFCNNSFFTSCQLQFLKVFLSFFCLCFSKSIFKIQIKFLLFYNDLPLQVKGIPSSKFLYHLVYINHSFNNCSSDILGCLLYVRNVWFIIHRLSVW